MQSLSRRRRNLTAQIRHRWTASRMDRVRVLASTFSVELPEMNSQLYQAQCPPDMPVRSVSFWLSPSHYLQFRSRVLTASRVAT